MSEWRSALAVVLWALVCLVAVARADEDFEDPLRDVMREKVKASIREAAKKTIEESQARFKKAQLEAKAWFGKNAYAGHKLKFLGIGSETLQERLELIQSAESSIYISAFKLVNEDMITRKISDLLCSKAQAGVDVRLLVDQGASSDLRESWKELFECGVNIFFFGKASWGLEGILDGIHEKLLIVDGKSVILGGSNYGMHYYLAKRSSTEWHDMDVRIDGPVACSYLNYFSRNWREGVHIERNSRVTAMGVSANDEEFLEYLYDVEGLKYCSMPTPSETSGGSKVLPLHVNPRLGDKNVLLPAYATLALAAEKFIWIYSPYLLMNPNLVLALQAAAARGVKVRVLTNSKESSDESHAMSFLVYQSACGLVKKGIEVREWTRESTLHRKGMLIDGKLSVMGSHNYDSFGGRHMSESIAISDDPVLAGRLKAEFLADFKTSDELTREKIKKRLGSFTRIQRIKAAVIEQFVD